METTKNENITSTPKAVEGNNEVGLSWGSIAMVIAGLLIIFLLALGTWTDNRFGTHLVLNTDLSSSTPAFLLFVTIMGIGVSVAGIVLLVLHQLGINKLNESREYSLRVGATFLIGVPAFILALSSISFAAFNWQYFDSQISNESGISDAAYAWMAMSMIGLGIAAIFTTYGVAREGFMDRRLYLTLRNTGVALIATGWLIFNICINAFGAFGGDAEVLVQGLTDGKISLIHLGGLLDKLNSNTDLQNGLVALGAMTGNEVLESITGITYADLKPLQVLQKNAWKAFEEFWDHGTGLILPIVSSLNETLGNLIWSNDGVGNLLNNIGTLLSREEVAIIADGLVKMEKAGPLMGVNNSANSILIFTATVGIGFVGLPVYGVLSYRLYEENDRSITFWASIGIIAAAFVIYFLLLMTPYMVDMTGVEEHGPLYLLLVEGAYEPSFAPGLVALPGQHGGIHSAIVYFSWYYAGTTVWTIAIVSTFAVPVIAFGVSALVILLTGKKENK